MKNVLVLTYWSYPEALIQSYTLPYVKIIRKKLPPGSLITLLTLEKERSTMEGEAYIRIKETLKAEGINWLPFLYKPFGRAAMFHWMFISLRLIALIAKRKISVIHCWCTPPGGIGYFLSLFLRKKLVLDSYEPHAEAMVENGTWTRNSFAFRLLFWLERKQSQRATYVISATEGMREYAARKYGVRFNNFFVKPACVDLKLFNDQERNIQLAEELNLNDKITCLYAGKFGGIYLGNEVFDFIREAINFWGDRFRFLLLTGHSLREIEGYCERAGVNKDQVIVRFVPHQQIPEYMKLADFALTPVKPVPTKRYCTPIKDGEYWATGLPVVIPANISDDSSIIEKAQIGYILKSFDRDEYRRAILKMEELRKLPQIRQIIRQVAIENRNFSIAENVYNEIYSTI